MYRMGWTDERLDDFAKHVDRRFDQVDQRFDEVDKRFDRFEKEVDHRFNRLEGDFRELRSDVDSNFKALQRALYLTGGGIIAALIGVIGTQL